MSAETQQKKRKKTFMENLYVNHLALVLKQNKVIQKEKGKCHARGWNDASVSAEWSRVQRLERLAHVGEWTAREAFRSARLEAAVLNGTFFLSQRERPDSIASRSAGILPQYNWNNVLSVPSPVTSVARAPHFDLLPKCALGVAGAVSAYMTRGAYLKYTYTMLGNRVWPGLR